LIVGVLMNQLNYRSLLPVYCWTIAKSEDIFLVLGGERESDCYLHRTVVFDAMLIDKDATLFCCRVQNTRVVLETFEL